MMIRQDQQWLSNAFCWGNEARLTSLFLSDSVCIIFWKRQTVVAELRPAVARGCVWGHILYLDWGGVFTTVVVLLLSHVQLFATPWTSARQAPLSFTISQSLLKLMCIESRMPSNHFILCRPQSFPASDSFPMSQLFTSGGQSIGASASATVLPMNIQG